MCFCKGFFRRVYSFFTLIAFIFNKANIPDDEAGLAPYVWWSRSTTDYYGTPYNTITRHVFLPSAEELLNLVDLNNANKTYSFLKGTNDILNHLWLRDADKSTPYKALNLNYDYPTSILVMSRFGAELQDLNYSNHHYHSSIASSTSILNT